MKTFSNVWFAFWVGCLSGVLFFGGCKSTPETIAYRTSKTAHITATAALHAWADYVAAKNPPVSQEKAVQAAWDKYRSAQLTLLDATKAYMSAGNPAPASAQEKFDAALAAAGAALADLVQLIRGFGAKL